MPRPAVAVSGSADQPLFLTGNTDWYNTTLGLCMLIGRFLLIIPVLVWRSLTQTHVEEED